MSKSKTSAFDHLNREQRQAVEHGVTGPGDTIAGPVLVAAGAGSGKTAVLACRVAHLIANGVEPSRICAITARSRFIPDAILDPFKVSAWRSDADERLDTEAAPDHAVQPDLAARIRNRWADA